ncbi:unnamed protein product [Calypogeia fissa]
MESVMLRAATPLRASSSQVFVGSPLLRPYSVRTAGQRSSSSVQLGKPRASVVPLAMPNEYGYVILTTAASAFLVQWQAFQVSGQRRKSGLKYPKMYEDAEDSVFNCYQRAHQNTLENYPSYLALLLIGGLGYPITSAVLGLVWIVGRLVYSLGYFTGDPNNRLKGMFHFFGFVGLFITCIVLGVRQTGIISQISSLLSS